MRQSKHEVNRSSPPPPAPPKHKHTEQQDMKNATDAGRTKHIAFYRHRSTAPPPPPPPPPPARPSPRLHSIQQYGINSATWSPVLLVAPLLPCLPRKLKGSSNSAPARTHKLYFSFIVPCIYLLQGTWMGREGLLTIPKSIDATCRTPPRARLPVALQVGWRSPTRPTFLDRSDQPLPGRIQYLRNDATTQGRGRARSSILEFPSTAATRRKGNENSPTTLSCSTPSLSRTGHQVSRFLQTFRSCGSYGTQQ